MQTNQIFNFSRFGRYTKSSLILNYRQLLIFWGGMISGIFLLYLIAAHAFNPRDESAYMPFILIFFFAGIIFAGISFSAFRKKEKTIALLTIPASALERFAYEFLEKIAAFIVFYPPVFYLASNFAIFIRNTMGFGGNVNVEYTVNGVVNKVQLFPYQYFSLNRVMSEAQEGQLFLFFSIAVLLFSIAFAGAATFRKYPLIKTIVFCGALVATVFGYIYFIIEKLRVRSPWIANYDLNLTDKQGFELVGAILIFFSLIILSYAYFKVKEKEAH